MTAFLKLQRQLWVGGGCPVAKHQTTAQAEEYAASNPSVRLLHSETCRWNSGGGERLFRVGSSSSPDGEAAVRPRLTLERQVTSRLLPDFTYQATGSSGRAPAGHRSPLPAKHA